jgi:hypothetical protein
MRKHIGMPYPNSYEQSAATIEKETPGISYLVAEDNLQSSCYHHKNTLSHYHSEAIEGASYANKPRLLVAVKG